MCHVSSASQSRFSGKLVIQWVSLPATDFQSLMSGIPMTAVIKHLQYLEKKPHQSWQVFMQVLYPGRIGIWRCCFCGGRKTGEPRRKTLGARQNQQQTQPTFQPRSQGLSSYRALPRLAPRWNRTQVMLHHLCSSKKERSLKLVC